MAEILIAITVLCNSYGASSLSPRHDNLKCQKELMACAEGGSAYLIKHSMEINLWKCVKDRK